TAEIKKVLANEYPFVIEETENPTTEAPPYDIPRQLEEYQKKQEDFNKHLIEKLHEQQKYIKELLENHEKEMKDIKKLNSSNDKRTEHVEKILVEHKVKKNLKEKAFDLWNQKPAHEKNKKIGWFRKEEDLDKRDLFIKKYIDDNFEK